MPPRDSAREFDSCLVRTTARTLFEPRTSSSPSLGLLLLTGLGLCPARQVSAHSNCGGMTPYRGRSGLRVHHRPVPLALPGNRAAVVSDAVAISEIHLAMSALYFCSVIVSGSPSR